MEGGEDDSTTRIYVGGLGESVTSDDLCTIFSKIGGDIKAVDIIRTKGRSFAYIDFSPSSHNSLSKLFSTYNGCVWKGKRLRLEKAKEHYLDRLKQEWAEDAQLASSTYTAAADDDTDKNMESFKKPMKELSSEKKQLRIFFPRLQKLKSLSFSGTGKHRYSFRRVEVPPLPTHFCDCEEHSGSVYTTEKKSIPVLEEQGGGMSKEELDMMNSVMNKLFEMENVSATAHSDIVLTKEQERSIKVSDDFQSEENEGYSEDDDNLIINVVQRRKETAFTDQESKLNKGQASKDGPTQDVLKRQTRRHDDGNRKGSVYAVSEGNGSFQSNLNEPGSILEAKLIEPESIAKQSDPKLSWSQKSSWRELIGNKSSSAMNISDILPGISSNKEEKSKSDSITNSKNSKNKKLSRRENQKGRTNKPEVLDKIEVEVPAETQPAKQDSDCMPNSKNEKLLRHENQRGQTDEQEVLDKIEGPAETQPTKQDSYSIANSKNKKLLRHENQGGQTDKPAVLDKIEVEGPAETQPTKQDSDSTPNSKNSKNNKLLRHENQRGQTENQGVLDKIEVEGPAETQPTKQDSASNEIGRGSAWLNKASWTQLVASNSSSSFSIAQILPGLNFEKQEPVKPDGVIIADSTSCKHSDITEKQKSHTAVDGEMALGFERDRDVKSTPELSQHMVVGNNDVPAPTDGKYGSATKQAAPPTENIYRSAKKQFDLRTNAGGVLIGESCSFMRTDASLKEWENIKAALSGSRKRKR